MDYTTNCSKHLEKLKDLSLFVDDATNLRPDIRSPYVGAASFAHKGGVRKMRPLSPLGAMSISILPCGKSHGTCLRYVESSIMMKAKEMGMDVDGRPEMKSFLEELKQLEFKGYEYESADASLTYSSVVFCVGKRKHLKYSVIMLGLVMTRKKRTPFLKPQ